MTTVPAQSFSAPARAAVIAAARVIPAVWGVFVSRSPACTTRTPCCRQSSPPPSGVFDSWSDPASTQEVSSSGPRHALKRREAARSNRGERPVGALHGDPRSSGAGGRGRVVARGAELRRHHGGGHAGARDDRYPAHERRALGDLVGGGALGGLARALGRLLGGLQLEVGAEQVGDLALLALASSECHVLGPTRGSQS